MSRTRHKLPSHSLRCMKVQNRRKGEEAANDHLRDTEVPYRHINRMAAFWTVIPDPWNDKCHAAWKEFHNKNHDFSKNDSHWTLDKHKRA